MDRGGASQADAPSLQQAVTDDNAADAQGSSPRVRPQKWGCASSSGSSPAFSRPSRPRPFRPRLAAWLEQPVLVVPELRAMIRTAVRAYRIRCPSPLPLSEEELSSIRTPLYLVLGKRSLLVHPQRQAERVPHLIPGVRAEIISDTGHGPQIDHAGEINRRMLNFMASVD